MQKYKVAVQCLCFNHAPYVERTLDGLSSQTVNFKYLAVIIDDASTDGTQDVINKYIAKHFFLENPKPYSETDDAIIFHHQHKENKNFYLTIIFLKYNFYQKNKSKGTIISKWTKDSEYFAFCECDDYWIYNFKLQEQVNFMDQHPEYGLIYTDYDIHNYDTGEYIHAAFKNGIKPIICSFEDHLIRAAYIAPMSWLSRKPLEELLRNYEGPKSTDTSFIVALEFFLKYKVHYIDKVTCVYGKHAGSATKQASLSKQYEYTRGVYSTQKYYLEKYHLQQKYPDCLDYFINAYYCYIIAAKKEEDYADVTAFFKKKGRESIKYRLFGMMMKSKMTMPLLRAICKYRIKNQ